jgi:hypothetical protein
MSALSPLIQRLAYPRRRIAAQHLLQLLQ